MSSGASGAPLPDTGVLVMALWALPLRGINVGWVRPSVAKVDEGEGDGVHWGGGVTGA